MVPAGLLGPAGSLRSVRVSMSSVSEENLGEPVCSWLMFIADSGPKNPNPQTHPVFQLLDCTFVFYCYF